VIVALEKPGTPEELVHVGVKGMRWGVRKERETSDGKSASRTERRQARRNRRADKHEAAADRAQVEIDKIKANPSRWVGIQRRRNEQARELERYRDTHLKAAKDLREDRMTDFQKKAIIGTGAAAAVLVAYGSYKMVDSGTAHQILNRNVPLKQNDLLSRKMSPDSIMKEVVAPINPNYGELGTKMNCRRATFAYEMRRRGMDVRATKSVSGTGQTVAGMLNATDPKANFKTGRISMLGNLTKEQIAESKGARRGPITEAVKLGGMGKEPIGKWSGLLQTVTPREKSQTIFEAIAEHPEGARGELGVRWNAGGAHSMAWEKINGKVHIFDTQNGERYTQESFKKVASNIQEVGMTRLDNLELNQNYLRRWVTNVK
jgi:hypothetical protein